MNRPTPTRIAHRDPIRCGSRDVTGCDAVRGRGPIDAHTGGNSKWDEPVVETEVLVPEGTPPRIARDLRASLAVLDDIGGTVERDDRGIAIVTQLNERAARTDVPARLLVMLLNARTTLGDVPLPADPVGLGARWETRKTRVLYGFKVRQVNTYTLIARAGDELPVYRTALWPKGHWIQ